MTIAANRDGRIPPTTKPAETLNLVDPNDIVSYAPWDIDFRQLEPGPMTTRIVRRTSARVTLLEISMDRAAHQQGQSPEHVITLGLPVTLALRFWRGVELESPGLINFGQGSAFEGVSGPGFAGLTVSISQGLLIGIGDQLGLALPDDFLNCSLLPVRRRTSALMRLTHEGSELLRTPGAPFGGIDEENFVAGLIGAAADAEAFDDRSPMIVRTTAVARAIELMQEQLHDGIAIGRLCADTGASWRTLTRGFRERFGIGPKAYFNRLRLSRVRSVLLLGTPTRTVTDVANEFGFWHMGQFARDYRHMFGELPSVTLSRSMSRGRAVR